jgi:hypothetical protein
MSSSQVSMDYVFVHAAQRLTRGHTRPRCMTVLYDIYCSWGKYLRNRITNSETISLPEWLLDFNGGIGYFHVSGHLDECFVRFCTLYLRGVGLTEGEIIETIWAVLNKTARAARSMSLANRQEVLEANMGEWNWNKLLTMGQPIFLRLTPCSI